MKVKEQNGEAGINVWDLQLCPKDSRFFAVLTEGSVSIGNQTPEFAHFTGD